MHEVDMTKALIATLKNWDKEQPENHKIEKVHLIVGKFTCVEPASLQFAFVNYTKNTFLEGVELAIQETPLIAFCADCNQEYLPDIGSHYSCPRCQSPMQDIRSGRELKIDRIQYSSLN